MIKNIKNEKLSQNRKRRTEKKIKMGDTKKYLSNKIKTKTKKRIENLDKIRELKSELCEIKYDNSPNKLQSELKKLKKFMLLIKIYMRINKNY